jgi:hypothetical protein
MAAFPCLRRMRTRRIVSRRATRTDAAGLARHEGLLAQHLSRASSECGSSAAKRHPEVGISIRS